MAQILIADDDPRQGDGLAELLAQTPGLDRTDVELIKAADGHRAVTSLPETTPNVFIVALTGQGTRALSLCQAIRKSPAGNSTRIAVVGGKVPDPEVLRQIEQDFSARFFAKPFELSQLTSYVASALGRPNSGPVKKRRTTSFGAGDDGELAHRRLAAVLLDLTEAGDSGLLHLHRGKIEKTISVSEGRPFAIRSNAREETLGQFLLAQGIINARAHADSIRRASSSRRRIGAVLVEIGAITQVQLAAALSAQVRFKLLRSLRWPDGRWRFEPRLDVYNSRGDALDVETLVVRGLAESARLSPLPRHIQNLKEGALRVGSRGRRLFAPLAAHFGADLVGALLEPTDFHLTTVLTKGFSKSRTYGLIDVLWHLDSISALSVETAADAREVESISVAELSAQSHRRATTNAESKPLFDLLFTDAVDEFAAEQRTGALPLSPTAVPAADGSGAHPLADGAIEYAASANSPGALEFDDIRTVAAPQSAPKELLGLFLRIQGNDHYGVVGADERAEPDQIERAVAKTEAELARAGVLEGTNELPLARAVKEAFERARDVLLDSEKRATYDGELRASRGAGENDPIRAEVAFGRAAEAMASEQWPIAVRELHAAVEAAPEEATYRAELGWCHYLKGGRAPRAADQARPHLNQALAIDYDHPAAHEYKGLISADLGSDDDEAIFHLRRALDGDPTRAKALQRLERLYEYRGELRSLERQYRRLIQQSSGTELEVDLWLRMARLYRSQLDDPKSAEIALAAASQLAPRDPRIANTIAEYKAGSPRFSEKAAPLVERWLAQPYDATAGKNFLAVANQSGAHDSAFVAASILVALGAGDDRANQLYQRYRPRFVVRAQRRVDGGSWDIIRDSADDPALVELLALLAPVIHQVSPVTFADLEVGPREHVVDSDLPQAFVRVRDYVSHVLSVPPPQVYVRSDFEEQVHVGGMSPPILLVGQDVVVTPERLELAFRLGRAMTYLPAGRSLGGSHSGTLLKRVVLAAFYVSHPETPAPQDDAELGAMINSIQALAPGLLHRLRELIDFTASRSLDVNLSAWKKSLARTADRIGLVLCGDVPSALRFTRDTAGTDAATELLRFAIDGGFAKARAALGLAIEV